MVWLSISSMCLADFLSIYGQRNNIKVWRQENGKQHMYQVNLNEGKNLVQSPVYYLKQNDVIYVEPNDTKKMNSTPNGNTWSTPGFWISTTSITDSRSGVSPGHGASARVMIEPSRKDSIW